MAPVQESTDIGLKDIVIQDKPFNIFLVLSPVRAGFNPLFEFQYVLFYSEYGCFLHWSLMGNCVGKEYFLRPHLILCYIKREKIILTKEAIFPISQFYFLLLTMLLVRLNRDLCTIGGGCSVVTKHTHKWVFCPCPGNPFWNAMAWEGQGAAELAGWAQQEARSCCPVPALHPASPSFLLPSSSGCCPFRGKAAVGQSDLVSHHLYIHSALLVFKSLDVLTVFLI